jgi:uncharacterized protein
MRCLTPPTRLISTAFLSTTSLCLLSLSAWSESSPPTPPQAQQIQTQAEPTIAPVPPSLPTTPVKPSPIPNPALEGAAFKALDTQKSDAFTQLFQHGLNPNARNQEGQKLLHIAVKKSDATSARLLLKQGAEVDGLNKYGETPLMLAAIQGQLEMVKLLHRYGALINPATDWSPLCYGASGGFIPVIEFLIQNGADLDHKCINDITPLMMAIRQEKSQAALYLLNQGASAADQSIDGKSIWQWAKEHQQKEILQKLKSMHLDEE